MTNIAICGACGKMGRVIYDIISNRSDCKVVAGVDLTAQSYADFPVVEKIIGKPQKKIPIKEKIHLKFIFRIRALAK